MVTYQGWSFSYDAYKSFRTFGGSNQVVVEEVVSFERFLEI